MNYANILTPEQKEAFRKGDKYYKSPFKNINTRNALAHASVMNGVMYTTSTRTRIHEAMLDSWKSRSWN